MNAPGYYIVLGPERRLIVEFSRFPLGNAVRFRTHIHAQDIADKLNADLDDSVSANFGPGEIAS